MTPTEAYNILTNPPKYTGPSLSRQKMREARGFLRFARIAEKSSWRHQHLESAASARKLAVMYLAREVAAQ